VELRDPCVERLPSRNATQKRIEGEPLDELALPCRESDLCLEQISKLDSQRDPTVCVH
jgi:hypothetical protein